MMTMVTINLLERTCQTIVRARPAKYYRLLFDPSSGLTTCSSIRLLNY